MKQQNPLVQRLLLRVYLLLLVAALLWTVLTRPAEHMVCQLFLAGLGISGGNLILQHLKHVSASELRWTHIFLCASVLAGAALTIVSHILLH